MSLLYTAVRPGQLRAGSPSLEPLEHRCLPTCSVPADDFGNFYSDAHVIELSRSGSGSQTGRLDYNPSSRDVDMFRVVAPVTGRLVVRQQALPGSDLDSALTVQGEWPALPVEDHSEIRLDSQVVVDVTAGATYYVMASGQEGSTGAYRLTFRTLPPLADDFGGDESGAQSLSLNRTGAGSQAGVLGTSGDVDAFRVVAPVTGRLVVRQQAVAGSDLDSFLTVNGTGSLPSPANDNSGGRLDSQVVVDVTAGATYYVMASGQEGSTGAYRLTFRTLPPLADDFGDQKADAAPLLLDSRGVGSQSGVIGTSGDVDVFRVVPPLTGGLVVRLTAAFGSSLDGNLTIRSLSSGGPEPGHTSDILAFNDDAALGTPSSLIVQRVQAGGVVFIEVAGSGQSTGQYTLTVSGLASPQQIVLDSSGSGSPSGVIETPGATDTLEFVAPVTGLMTIDQARQLGSALDSVLTVIQPILYAEPGTGRVDFVGGALLAFNDDFGGTRDSRVQFSVFAGQTYDVQAAGFDISTGAYRLTFRAGPLEPLPSAGFAAVDLPQGGTCGRIGKPGGADLYRFVAAKGGVVAVDMGSTGGLRAALSVFDASGNPLAFNAGFEDPRIASVDFSVVAGGTYYLRVGGVGTGAYLLRYAYYDPFGGGVRPGLGIAPPDSAAKAPFGVGALSLVGIAKGALEVVASPVNAGVGASGTGSRSGQNISPLGPRGASSLVLVATLGGSEAETNVAGAAVQAVAVLNTFLVAPVGGSAVEEARGDALPTAFSEEARRAWLGVIDAVFARWDEAGDWLLQLRAAAVRAITEAFRSTLPGADTPPPPPGKEDSSLPGPTGEQEKRPQSASEEEDRAAGPALPWPAACTLLAWALSSPCGLRATLPRRRTSPRRAG